MGLMTEQQEAKAEPQESMTEKVANAMIAKTPEQYQDALQRVVAAGKKLMYSKETHQMMVEELADDPIRGAGEGAVTLMSILMKESRNTIPGPAFMPAMVILLMDALDFVAQTKNIEIGSDEIGQATEAMTEAMLSGLGITPEHLNEVVGKTHELMQDPEVKAKYDAHMAQQGA